MLIGYSMPSVTSVSITGGAWLTADGGAACCDGKPARKARLSWSAGNTTSSYVTITINFATASPPRILAALGLSVPVGCRIDFLDSANGSLGGTTASTRTIRMPDGTVGIFAVAYDPMANKSGVNVRIYNDASGSTWISNGGTVDVGELVAMPGVEIDHGRDWEEGFEDPADRTRTRSSQLNTIRRSAYRTCAIQLVANSAAMTRQSGLPNGTDWAKIRAAIAGDARCIVIPRWGTAAAMDAAAINATALYGAGKISAVRHLGGDWYGGDSLFEEVPAL